MAAPRTARWASSTTAAAPPAAPVPNSRSHPDLLAATAAEGVLDGRRGGAGDFLRGAHRTRNGPGRVPGRGRRETDAPLLGAPPPGCPTAAGAPLSSTPRLPRTVRRSAEALDADPVHRLPGRHQQS
ncbi:hypothetical protein GCM10017779_40660 [Streptomyces capillispiralis]|nr:hypothetical protein GCM10017779_40660 [Streptomyces capillispiralis]